jgi:transposase
MFQPLTDAQWAKIAPLLPAAPPRKMNRGRPRADARKVLNSILWVLRTGASWDDLPKEGKEGRFVAFQTAHRYLQNWVDDGTFRKVVTALAKEADLNLSECFIDGSFIPAKGGALKSAMGAKVKALLSN